MKSLNLDDIGRRIDHLADLQQLWSDGLALLTRPDMYHSSIESEMAEELEICLKHLETHMSKDFNQSSYAQEINKLSTIPVSSQRIECTMCASTNAWECAKRRELSTALCFCACHTT